MTIEDHLKAYLGEQLFALAARQAEIDALRTTAAEVETLRKMVAEQQARLAELERQKSIAADSPFRSFAGAQPEK